MSLWARRFTVALAVALLLVLGTRVVIGSATRARLQEALAEFEETFGHRTLADLAPPAVPDRENVAPLVLDLVEELDEAQRSELADQVRRFQALPPSRWSVLERQLAADFVASCGPRERYAELAGRQESDFGLDYSRGWDTPLPPFVGILGIARCALIEGRLALSRGDLESFLVAYRVLVNVSRSQRTEPLLISQLISIAVERYQQYLAHQALGSGVLDLETIETLLAIDDRPSPRVGLARGLQAEALVLATTPSSVVLQGIEPEGRPLFLVAVERAVSYLVEPYGDLIRAATLENRSREIASLDGDLVETFRQRDEGTFYEASSLRRDVLAPNIEDILLKAYATETSAILSRAALGAARDIALGAPRAPRQLPDNPMTGDPIRWAATDDGFSLSAPEAEALWDERAGFSGSLPPIFDWVVGVPQSAAESD